MKQSRIFSVAVASAAVLGSVVAVSGTANAAFDPDTADRVTTNAQLGQEVAGTPYPATGWFQGVVTAPAGTVTFDGAGLNSAGGNVQLLNAYDAPASTLTDLVVDADFVSLGAATFQVPIFANGTGTGTEFTTLRPVATGEELTFSYDYLAAAEWRRAPELYFWDERWSFDCRCGAPDCVGRVDRYRIRA